MNSNDLHAWQTQRIQAQIGPGFRYLALLRRRMEQRHFPPNDRMFQAVVEAHHAMQHLHMSLHYLGCKSGVGRPPRTPGQPQRGGA